MRKPRLGILLKPASSDCNMACDYCYYRNVRQLYSDVSRPRMSLDVVDSVCEQYRALEPVEIKIGWQGGEPTLMGLDFFRKAIELETRHARPGDCWGNTIQTNGVLLDDEWCEFLAHYRFLVGLSIDGPPELNAMRKFHDGRPAWDAAMRALALMRQHGVEFNVLVVVSTATVGSPQAVFRFLVENDIRFSQCIPCTEPAGDGKVTAHSITGAQWADFMLAFFDAWVEKDDPGFYNRHIDNWLHLYFRLPPESCEYRPDCSNLITIEWNGDVYPCDFFVEKRFLMGNVLTDTLERMLQGRAFRSFVQEAEATPAICRDCKWLWACNGGCNRQRGKLGIGLDGQPYMCEANRRIFEHVFGTLDELKAKPIKPQLHGFLNDIQRRVDSGEFDRRRAAGAARGRPARGGADRPSLGRNDPCPCGSGRKFKQCCMRRSRATPRR
jgi:uncharacterized protein